MNIITIAINSDSYEFFKKRAEAMCERVPDLKTARLDWLIGILIGGYVDDVVAELVEEECKQRRPT
jgi:hypothetical protein